jgi:hypothetical protein
MTEDEARTKWCQFAWRIVQDDGLVLGDLDKKLAPLSSTRCIASNCMAWREISRPIGVTDRYEAAFAKHEITGGFCGLAGKP